MAVPSWNAAGLLPPIDLNDPVSRLRSPYLVSVLDFVAGLATTDERRVIADGLLRYRAGLHRLGFVDGFQWVNGSFCTDVETHEGRPPGDVDVVTFLHTPVDMDRAAVVAHNPQFFLSPLAKEKFHCDAYVVDFGGKPESVANLAAYWSSVWGHTRAGIWKGFLQISLNPEFDERALNLLNGIEVAA
ncbi:hypothetical protein EN794_011835 [Mesorhizobium sp. M00.F.Ca.ET.151.01.1.1]|nr:hypothetical protein EN842_09445 [bacterium M00.F.Ca.ET.199.01.1.1]TGT07927.1 hypothetical protein EN820_07670 [bacterium M00.F.Ca.ET.177.01.1.1]TGT65175.1 hypothetical protein EN813_007675 [Mesorhizobium sp. M00.F.Ca.ET.170.01.1.1]TGU15319.1 hypothetical protein EN806_07680 [bacterium M00.F.Ca.ET.163.01.1.1]TGU98032.1 hypothetical protein EN794_011835 [Mesorhizobium sp. M00.F.Ca.ET.151.01.1.1]TGV59731.1 hypothetical protein EN784_13225 [bacterium M00.F.Ca.ET.141.01.1.1]